MADYLGEFPVEISESRFADYTPADWAMHYIGRYGQIDGDHHKAWVLDRVMRILKGTSVNVTLAKWSNGEQEYRYRLDEPSTQYREWVEMMLYRDENGDPQYSYNKGIAP